MADTVKIPASADEAAAMLRVSAHWLEAHAPDVLRATMRGTSDALDAARYRWLKAGRLMRQGVDTGVGQRVIQTNPMRATMSFGYWCDAAELDAAIDAAMAREAK